MAAALVPSANVSTSQTSSSSLFPRIVTSQAHVKVSFPSSRTGTSRAHRRKASASCRYGLRSGSWDTVPCQGLVARWDSASARVRFCSDDEQQSSTDESRSSASDLRYTGLAHWLSSCREPLSGSNSHHGHLRTVRSGFRCNCTSREIQNAAGNEDSTEDADEDLPSAGVAIAVKFLHFYKREISPLLPGSCRFVPTCSEYGMQAFKKYGVVKGAILTAWRLSRCNPLGGSGFDPPRWFDEPRPPPY